MSIELSHDERNRLLQLAQRKMEPTRRQKAIALLDLAEGKTSAEAAQHAGILKDDVDALAVKFSEHGLPGVGLGANSKIQVDLIRPGVPARKYRLTKGDTIADLLSRSKISTTNRIVLIDNVEAVESSPLHEGAVVLIAPRATNGAPDDAPHQNIPSLQDDATFEQYRKILKVRRKLRAPRGVCELIILDTDALSHHMKMNSIGSAIETRMSKSLDPDFRITSISVFEMADGALALYKDLRKKRKQLIAGFNLIQEVIEYLGLWRGRIRPYDDTSDQIYKSFAPRLRQELGDDARIASVALANGAAVWTCNTDDFTRVPGLVVYSAETGLRLA